MGMVHDQEYADINFRKGDTTAKASELVDKFQRLATYNKDDTFSFKTRESWRGGAFMLRPMPPFDYSWLYSKD